MSNLNENNVRIGANLNTNDRLIKAKIEKSGGGGGGGTDNYEQLSNKPQINGITLIGNILSSVLGISYNDLTDLPTLFSGSYNDLTDKPTLFSGSYNDLTDKPTIPSALSDLTDDASHRVVTDTEKSDWNGKSDFSGSYDDLTDKPTLFSGSYDDLTDKPDLFSGDYNDLTNKPTIPTVPTDVSAFNNDSGYITNTVNDLTNYYNKTTIDTMLIMDISNTIFGGE